MRGGAVALALGATACAIDYQAVANIYAPRPGAGPLTARIALGMRVPFWGHQADYARVNLPDDDEPSLPPDAFRRTTHNLLDTRLMMAYARSLAEHGELDKARHVAQRVQEFRNPASRAWLAPCMGPHLPQTALPFQCQPPERPHDWRELVP
jgi:hypothetical protein